jgi:hypothetical protein
MPIPADCTYIGRGRGPEGNTDCVFFIRTSTLEVVCREGPWWRYRDLELVEPCLQEPLMIYEGLYRDEYRDGCAHCCQPSEWWVTPEKRGPVPPGLFFMTYTQPMSGGLVVLDWAWRPEDPHFIGRPCGWQSFDRGQVWPPSP